MKEDLEMEDASQVPRQNLESIKIEEKKENLHSLPKEDIFLILQAMRQKRWYFFHNKPQVVLDKETGLLWANLKYFPYRKDDKNYYTEETCKELIKKTKLDGYEAWVLPTYDEFKEMIQDKSFPFQQGFEYRILNENRWFCDCFGQTSPKGDKLTGINLYNLHVSLYADCVLPCCRYYKNAVMACHKKNTEGERLQAILLFMLENQLEPVFEQQEIARIYKRICGQTFPVKQQLVDTSHENATKQIAAPSFDYHTILAQYDIQAIHSSVIQYYEAIISVVDDCMNRLYEYESLKGEIDFQGICFHLTKTYQDAMNLTPEENALLRDRQLFLKNNFSLGISDIQTKLLSMKRQAEQFFTRISVINEKENSLQELALLEKEARASFPLVVENMASMINKALLKMAFLEKNKEFIRQVIQCWEQWNADYYTFKTVLKEKFIQICENERIDQEIYEQWFVDWQNIRFLIEESFLPLIRRGLDGSLLLPLETGESNVLAKVIHLLETFKNEINQFYLEDKKDIYQKFAFQLNGALQEKFETENELYKITAKFLNELNVVIFALPKTDDRLFLLKWAQPLLQLQMDEIYECMQNENIAKVSQEVLTEFVVFKQKNLAIYLSDSLAYGEALKKREKEYNALIYKMRKDLKQQEHKASESNRE